MDVKIVFVLLILESMIRGAGAVCAIDLCTAMMVDMCPEKTCELLEDCNVRCVCDETSTAPDCGNMTSLATQTTIEPTEVSTANASECLCIHGNCSNGDSGKCICENGWSGENCDLECTLDCNPGYQCKILEAIFRIPICESTAQTTTLLPLSSTTEPVVKVYNACSDDYTMRPPSERTCESGWPCTKGICRSNGSRHWCECDSGATGQLCQDTCCKQCLNGVCFFNIATNEEMCNCYVNYSGSFCETWDPPKTHALPEDPTWHYWVVGSCAFVLMLLICLMVIVPYYLWRHRVILVMKVVHYFQEYEDEDDRQWDVFISYKSTTNDESFVIDTLFPKLEKELGFKANIHQRDFVAGETISNNIISAVQGSRRTIMVISPSYVMSEFTRFEYQVAQQEMLKRKHRIIPILLEDISECKETMDPTLKVILGSVTYIEWPKIESEKKLDKFWKRIELSMPKKKNRSLESDPSPVLNGKNSTTSPTSKQSDIHTDISSNTNFKYAVTDANVYSVIDESKLNNEEVYDRLNESEMLTQVMKRQTEAGEKSKEDELLNVLKIDL